MVVNRSPEGSRGLARKCLRREQSSEFDACLGHARLVRARASSDSTNLPGEAVAKELNTADNECKLQTHVARLSFSLDKG